MKVVKLLPVYCWYHQKVKLMEKYFDLLKGIIHHSS